MIFEMRWEYGLSGNEYDAGSRISQVDVEAIDGGEDYSLKFCNRLKFEMQAAQLLSWQQCQ